MNTQLWTVGGSKAQGKNMKKKCTELEFLVLWLLTCYMFMILGKSLLGASAHLQQNLTEQLQHTNGKIHVRRPRKLPDSISSSLLRKFSIKNLEVIKRMSRWAWLYWFSCMDSADSDTLNSALCLVSFTTDLNVERKKKKRRGRACRLQLEKKKSPTSNYTAIRNWECKDHSKECKANEMVMLISHICTCFTLCKVASFTLSHLFFTTNTTQVLIFPSDR